MIIGKIGPEATPARPEQADRDRQRRDEDRADERDGEADRAGEREPTVVETVGEQR